MFEAILLAGAKRILRRPLNRERRDSRKTPSLLQPYPKYARMKREKQIPYYASDGTSLGFRTEEAARRLVAGGFVEASYGRKGHLKAIWSRQQDGGSPVETRPPSARGTVSWRNSTAVAAAGSCGGLIGATMMAHPSSRAGSSSRWSRTARSHESPATDRRAAHRPRAWRVPWRPGAPEAAGGPTGQPGA